MQYSRYLPMASLAIIEVNRIFFEVDVDLKGKDVRR